MKRWVVFIEITDSPIQGIDPQLNERIALDELSIREIFNRLDRELPSSITLKIRGLTGPFAEYGKAAGA